MRALRIAIVGLFAACAAAACRGQRAEPRLESTAPTPTDGGSATPFAGPFEGPALHVVLHDPRLAAARERAMLRDFAGAAQALEATRAGLADHALSSREECAWAYTSARLHMAADDAAGAAAGFDQVAGVGTPPLSCDLAGYASLRAAAAYAKLGKYDEAGRRARAVPSDLASHDEADLLLADALAARGDRAAALPLWRSHAAATRGGWVDVAVKIATADLDGVEGDATSHAAAAKDLATRIIVEAPKIAESSGATLARARAVALLHPKDPTAVVELGPLERARQARGWLDSGEPAKAFAEASAVLASVAPGKDNEAACVAATARAQASAKMPHVVTADAWGDAIASCETRHDDALASALYAGAKSSLNAKRTQEAAERFSKVEELFPSHRLADDARLQGALIALDEGDRARFTSMLLALPDDYPQGDMRGEALFRVALSRMTHGDWEGAKPVLDRIVAMFPSDRHWATCGRAAYFRARASAKTGDTADARARYAKIVQDDPLTFYMTQAYARLAEDDGAAAKRLLDEGASREPPGTFLTKFHPELQTKAFVRSQELLEVGDVDAASRELAAGGLTTDAADPELVWLAAELFTQADAPEIGHAFARRRVTDHLPHYPAGRWRAMWEIAFPKAFEPLVVREAAASGIPRALAWAIMREESDFYPEAKSPSNAYGLMQLISSTARGIVAGTPYTWTEDGLKRPDASVALGSKLLGSLRASFGNGALAIAAYNGGGGAVGRWLAARGDEDFDLWVEDIPWEETRGYVKRVLASEAAYAYLYDPTSLPEVLSLPLRIGGQGRGAPALR